MKGEYAMNSEYGMNTHGGNLDQWQKKFPTAQQPWLDLSTGICPWPYPLDCVELAQPLSELPSQRVHQRCVESMAAAFNNRPTNILPVPGTEIAIRLLPHLLETNLIVSPPTYGDYVTAWQACGRQIVSVENPLLAPEVTQTGFTTIICNPNNPDGRVLKRHEIESLYKKIHAAGNWLIIDEAYGELLEADSVACLAGRPNLVVLRSLGKFYGLPGLRLGAVLAEPAFLKQFDRWFGHWSVSTLALSLGGEIYNDVNWRAENRQRLNLSANRVVQKLTALNIQVAGHSDLFIALLHEDAALVWQRLMASGIYTRRFDQYPKLLRIGLPPDIDSEERLEKQLAASL